jgi:GT2 family glycosyltransferase
LAARQQIEVDKLMRIVALLAAYNEERFIGACLEHLVQQGAQAYLIDNGSTDQTVAIAESYLGRGLIGIEPCPHAGYFAWDDLLARKEALANSLDGDWFMHVDSDEFFSAPHAHKTLAEVLAEVDALGYNAIDCDEFTFVPTRESPDHDHPDFLRTMRWYYHYRPERYALQRAWKKQAGPLGLVDTGGHELRFPGLRVYPERFYKRHYLCLSIGHAASKYGDRKHDPVEVRAGWHRWRARLQPDAIKLPRQSELCEYGFDNQFDTSRPWKHHFLAQAARPPADNTAVCIAGMHRSGTSLVAQLLCRCGVYLGPEERLVPAAPDNEAGFWENEDFKALNDRILARLGSGWDIPPLPSDWELAPDVADLRVSAASLVQAFESHRHWGWKDPRNSLTLPFWQLLLPDLRVLICLRHPLEVARSLQRRGHSSPAFGFTLWEAYYLRLLAVAPAERRLVTHYDTFFRTPAVEMRRILTWLKMPVPVDLEARISQTLAPALRHHAAGSHAQTTDSLPPTVAALYALLCDEAGYSHGRQPGMATTAAAGGTSDRQDWWAASATAQAQVRAQVWQQHTQLLEQRVADRDEMIVSLRVEAADRDEMIVSLRSEAANRQQALESLRAEAGAKGQAIHSLEAELAGRDATIEALRNEMRVTEADLEARASQLAHELQLIQGSRAWRVAVLYWRVATALKQPARKAYLGLREQLRRWLPYRLRSQMVELRRRFRAQLSGTPVGKATSHGPHPGISVTFAPPRRPDVVVLAIIDWDFRYQRPQQLASQFAENGHRCFYVSIKFHNSGPLPEVAELAAGIYAVTLPGPVGMNVYQGQLAVGQEVMLAALDELRCSADMCDTICLVQLPFWAPLALAARVRWGWKVVYDCMDEHSGFSNVGTAAADSEASLLGQSDLVLATSRLLYAKTAPVAQRAILLPNAGDFDHFNRPARIQPLAQLRGPVIGYYGAIAEWFDVDMLHGAAQMRPDWHFVLIGHTFGADVHRLEGMPNVHMLGEQPYASLPGYLQRFDVACIPFKLNALTEATNPVKFYEYLSAGKPVVAVPLPELEPYRDLFYAARTAAEFVAQCEAALREDSAERQAARLNCARLNTWGQRYETLEPELIALFGRAAIVIVSYHNLDYLRQCLDSVFSQTAYPNFSVVVVDNGSGPELRDYLKERAATETRLHVILNDTNQGFARATNQGIQAAGPCEYVVLLNNDTVVSYGWLSKLVGYLRHPQVGLVGPVTNAIGNEAQIDIQGYRLEDLQQVAAARSRDYDGEVFDIPVLAMYCVAVRRSLLDEVGLLDERYAIGMFEDDDFALRVRQAGYRVICANDVFIHHWMRASFKQLPAEEYEALFAENRQRYEEKWRRAWEPHKNRHLAQTMLKPARLVPGEIVWDCNLCSRRWSTPLAELSGEARTCPSCGSTVRLRAIARLLSVELFGESLAMANFPMRRDLYGLGLDESAALGGPLAERLSFTSLHANPETGLDNTTLGITMEGKFDFVIATDLLNRAEPVGKMMANLQRLLKPGGLLLCGSVSDLEDRLQAMLSEAGFCGVRLHGEPFYAHGVYWDDRSRLPLVARRG